MKKRIYIVGLLIALCFVFLATPALAKIKLRVSFMPFPVHNQQVDWMKKWADTRPDVELITVPLSYDVYYPKVSNSLRASKGEFDIVWHNDDWGAAWMNFLEYVDDVNNFDDINPYLWKFCFRDKNGRSTAVPFVSTSAGLFYRKDLIPELPKTWKELQDLSIKLQKEGKTKWGYVTGMKFPHAYYSFLAFMWANLGDIVYPPFVRDYDMLEMFGWQPDVNDIRVIEMLEFWWDQIHRYKTVPPDNISYSRTAALAIFQAGDAAMTGQDAHLYGDMNDPAKSKVAGKVGVAPFPSGPRGNGGLSWDVPWAWGIPKNVPPENKKAAKELLGYLLTEEIQVDLWKKTGGIPVAGVARRSLSKDDPIFAQFAKATFESPVLVLPAHYYPKWPKIHSIFTDYCIKAMMGKRDDIRKVMEQCSEEIIKAFAD